MIAGSAEKVLDQENLQMDIFYGQKVSPHYVREHSLKLPDEFLALAISGNKIDPKLIIDLEKLEVDNNWWKNQKIN